MPSLTLVDSGSEISDAYALCFFQVPDPDGRITTTKMAERFKSLYDANVSKRNELKVLRLTEYSADDFYNNVIESLRSSVISYIARKRAT